MAPRLAAPVDRARLLAPGLGLMTVAPFVVAVRALLALLDASEPDFYWVFFAVGGTLGGLGMVLAAVATYRRPPFRWVVSGAVVALLGHNVVSGLPVEAVALAGPSLVHLGTGLLLWPLRRAGLGLGVLAGLGAYLRWSAPDAGNALLLAGVAGLLAVLVLAARDAAAPAGTPANAPDA